MYFNEIQMMLYYIDTCSIIKKMLHVFYTWFMICLVGFFLGSQDECKIQCMSHDQNMYVDSPVKLSHSNN